MIAVVDGKTYGIDLEDNALAKNIAELCPMKLDMTRSGNHEYYGALPKPVDPQDALETTKVKAGGVYYFAAWNAFSLVFRDRDIRPYSVFLVGHTGEALVRTLSEEKDSMTIQLDES